MEKKFYKTTIEIYSEVDISNLELSDIAREAEEGAFICGGFSWKEVGIKELPIGVASFYDVYEIPSPQRTVADHKDAAANRRADCLRETQLAADFEKAAQLIRDNDIEGLEEMAKRNVKTLAAEAAKEAKEK